MKFSWEQEPIDSDFEVRIRCGDKCWISSYSTEIAKHFNPVEEIGVEIQKKGEAFCALVNWLKENSIGIQIIKDRRDVLTAVQENNGSTLGLSLDTYLTSGNPELFIKTMYGYANHACEFPYEHTNRDRSKEILDLFTAHKGNCPKEVWVEIWNKQNPDLPAVLKEPDEGEEDQIIVITTGIGDIEVQTYFKDRARIYLGTVDSTKIDSVVPFLERIKDFRVVKPIIVENNKEQGLETDIELS